MLRRLFDLLLGRRAIRILRRLDPHLPAHGVLIDIGSGTGHNARAIRASRPRLNVIELDVVPMTPPGGVTPMKIDHGKLPLEDASVDGAVMLYVLHYVDDPRATLAEAARVIRGRLILLQTTAGGRIARAIWHVRDACLGQFPFHVCSALRLIQGGPCPLRPKHYFSRATLLATAERAGWKCMHLADEHGFIPTLSRDLIVFERVRRTPQGATTHGPSLDHHSGTQRANGDHGDA